uniref:Uncharacterized protein n=1 Tax=Peronospora matthiolae TaxID=2874970 RepID=A0AAV1T3Z8_9STRA
MARRRQAGSAPVTAGKGGKESEHLNEPAQDRAMGIGRDGDARFGRFGQDHEGEDEDEADGWSESGDRELRVQ